MKIAIVTDSTAFLSEEVKNKDDLFIIPIPVIIDGKSYDEGVDIQIEDYYPLLKTSTEFPKTSQPSIGELLDLYQRLAEQGYDAVISIHLSSGISGMAKTLESLVSSIDNIRVIPFDSHITSSPMGYMVESALRMVHNGEQIENIVQHLYKLRNNMGAYIVVEDLNNLVRGGRLTNGAALIGSLLKIKPVLRFDEQGKIVVFEKIRSSKKAFKRLDELTVALFNQPTAYKFFIIHANNLELAEEQQAILLKHCPEMDIGICHFGPVIGAHLGEGALGIGWVEK